MKSGQRFLRGNKVSDDILFEEKGAVGVATLNRPEALNALTLAMVCAFKQQLHLWNEDPRVRTILLKATPGRAFCAGGDVRWLYDNGRVHPEKVMPFFENEYAMNLCIAMLKKPFVALMDGITMGGGVGVSLHGRFPVATEHFVFAMPETSIGFFPDIGASYLLNRLPGELGRYLALTGDRLDAARAHEVGLLYACVPSSKLQDVQEEIFRGDTAAEVILAPWHTPSHSPWPERAIMDECFAAESVEGIFERLASSSAPFAQRTLETLRAKSPLALKVTLEHLRRTRGLSLAACLAEDYRLAARFLRSHDFYEGVRALLVDKDKSPRWQPAVIHAVSAEMVEAFF